MAYTCSAPRIRNAWGDYQQCPYCCCSIYTSSQSEKNVEYLRHSIDQMATQIAHLEADQLVLLARIQELTRVD